MRAPMVWVMLDTRYSPDVLGYIPSFIEEEDERPVKEQFNERYAFGGGWQPSDGWKINDNLVMTTKYPEDPPMNPIAMVMVGEETVLMYPHAMIAIIQKDGTYEVARMD